MLISAYPKVSLGMVKLVLMVDLSAPKRLGG
ncbi:MAG: hypothetical protein UW79_C0001G0041 [Candidatus Yanofskybacteria bacterium GW2011_GWA2_44_9]|uniref:Uncharacterized protein n=1 Tax=Candidatus Yanofskybacteria bacterium GW2011_GWA2_44_9 TaxID=1619025 RepID=A0A0G1KGZ2_9BACT|nr:MAG: hypothetical protein UW79_C0001G0041 [Candidatus Yanofskybacteria bacterium GW2011_GWA2_44_9]